MATKTKKKFNSEDGEMKWPFTKINYIYLGISIAVMILGYVLLGQGSMTLAPILLVLAYCVLVPIAIMKRDKTTEKESVDAE